MLIIMNFKLRYSVYPVRKKCTLILEPIFPVKVEDDAEYTISITPLSGIKRYGLRDTSYIPTDDDVAFFNAKNKHPMTPNDGVLCIDVAFPQEDSYSCEAYVDGKFVQSFELYALEDDLFVLTPYKGDNHMHTYMSDGSDSPMYMAAASCKLGKDYCLITDHHQYEPSIMTIDFYKDTDVDFLVIPGEEVHSPDNPVHIINFGGNSSINKWFRDNEEEYRDAVYEEIKKITEPMVDSDRYAAAACQVVFDKIRSVDGLAVLCHPHWICGRTFNESEDITDYLFDHKRFDVLELIAGGAYEVGTQLQISYYHDRETMPILGSSDAHRCFGENESLEPINYTIAFASSLEAESIKDAVRAGMTVAGYRNKLYGDYRLVKYGYFLLKNYYPEHDSMRRSLGCDMLRMASSGNNKNEDYLREFKRKRPSELFDKIRYR